MSGQYLVYFADPMCSWCYGFGPELDALMRERPGLRVDVVMGGLRAHNTEALTPEFRRSTAEHWSHVAASRDFPSTTRPSPARASSTTRSRPAAPWSPCAPRMPRARCPT